MLLAVALALGADVSKKLFAASKEVAADKKSGEAVVPKNPVIRDNQTHAEVEVDVRNIGIDAFEPEKFGRTVRITRQMALLASGKITSSFTITNAETGVVVAKSKKSSITAHRFPPLVQFVAALNISPDNPIVVMDQEMAKVILKQNAEQHYKHFVRATGLERAHGELAEGHQRLQETQKSIEAGRVELKALSDTLEQKRRKLAQVKGLTLLESRVADATRDVAWASLRAPEAAAAEAVAALPPLQAALEQATKPLSGVQTALDKKLAERDEKQCVRRLGGGGGGGASKAPAFRVWYYYRDSCVPPTENYANAPTNPRARTQAGARNCAGGGQVA